LSTLTVDIIDTVQCKIL